MKKQKMIKHILEMNEKFEKEADQIHDDWAAADYEHYGYLLQCLINNFNLNLEAFLDSEKKGK